MFNEFVRVPRDRIAVLIGKNGSIKKAIEQKTKSKLQIDSKSCEVAIQAKDALLGMKASEIAKAIARGFSPENAMQLINDDFLMQIVDLSDFVGKSEKAISQRKSRIIGTGGKAREKIEQFSGALISVYGKTVSIIGPAESMEIAVEAVEMLIKGATHKSVFDFLQRHAKPEAQKKFEL